MSWEWFRNWFVPIVSKQKSMPVIRPACETYIVLYFGRTGELEEHCVEAVGVAEAEAAFNELFQYEIFDVYKSTK